MVAQILHTHTCKAYTPFTPKVTDIPHHWYKCGVCDILHIYMVRNVGVTPQLPSRNWVKGQPTGHKLDFPADTAHMLVCDTSHTVQGAKWCMGYTMLVQPLAPIVHHAIITHMFKDL